MYNDINNLTRTKNELEELIRAYQTPLVKDSYILKKLNEGDEAENILITTDTIFIGSNRMQIKKLDGTIEKYTIEKYYPVDEKDMMIKELHKKVEELERKLNNESTEHIKSNGELNESNANDDGNAKSESKTNSKSTTKQNNSRTSTSDSRILQQE